MVHDTQANNLQKLTMHMYHLQHTMNWRGIFNKHATN
jgi:hypothetical protein